MYFVCSYLYGAVGIAGRSGDRISMMKGFTAPVQTGPGAHPDSYTIGTGPFAGVKRPGSGTDHPLQSISEVKERVEPYIYSLTGHFLG